MSKDNNKSKLVVCLDSITYGIYGIKMVFILFYINVCVFNFFIDNYRGTLTVAASTAFNRDYVIFCKVA